MEEEIIRAGKKYNSFQSFAEDLQKYSDTNFVQFYKRESRRLGCPKSLTLKVKPSSDLVYHSLTYYCVRSKQTSLQSREKKLKHLRNTRSMRDKCQAYIRVGLTHDDVPCLIIRSCFLLHNHPVTESDYKLHPAQRRLQPRARSFVLDMLQRGVSKEAILSTLKDTFGQVLLKKDLYNLAAKYGMSSICFSRKKTKKEKGKKPKSVKGKKEKSTSRESKRKSDKNYTWDTELLEEVVVEVNTTQEVLMATESIAVMEQIEEVEMHEPVPTRRPVEVDEPISPVAVNEPISPAKVHKPVPTGRKTERVLAHTSVDQILLPQLNVEIMEPVLVQKLKQQVLGEKPLEQVFAAELSAVEFNDSCDKKHKTVSILTNKINNIVANSSDELFEKRMACLETLIRVWTKGENINSERRDGRAMQGLRLRPKSVFLKENY